MVQYVVGPGRPHTVRMVAELPVAARSQSNVPPDRPCDMDTHLPLDKTVLAVPGNGTYSVK